MFIKLIKKMLIKINNYKKKKKPLKTINYYQNITIKKKYNFYIQDDIEKEN